LRARSKKGRQLFSGKKVKKCTPDKIVAIRLCLSRSKSWGGDGKGRERGGEVKGRVKEWKRGKEKRGGRGRSIKRILLPPTKGYRLPPMV